MRTQQIILLGAFSPATLYRGSRGVWYRFSTSHVAQNSAGTTAAAVDSPVGLCYDVSGNGINALQAVDANRPILKDGPPSLLLDGTNDGVSLASFSAGTLTSDMDCFVAVKRATTGKFGLVYESDGGVPAFFTAESGSGSAAFSSVGNSVTYFVNGIAVAGGTSTTRAQLDAALPVGQWLVLEARNLNLSAWAALGIGGYTTGAYQFNGSLGGEFVLCRAQTDSVRDKIRRRLARLVGVSL